MSKCWYCNEELTTANYCDEHIGICTKCYGSMFQVSNEFVKGLTDKIADLEAKLAESEKRIQAYEEIVEQKDKEISFANRDKTCIVKQLNDPKAYVLLEYYKELKQQLAEKDKRYGELHKCYNEDLREKYRLEDELKVVQKHHQDKISFAVEHINQFKDFILNNIYLTNNGDEEKVNKFANEIIENIKGK